MTVGRPGTLLGAIPDPVLHDVCAVLSPGDLLVLFTDGVTEARDADGRFYGDDRLVQVISVADRRADAVVHAVLDDVLEFQHDIARDDIAVVVVGVPADA
jgi:sigma-B regulation protein RsbU (phosphoserine phosphatase)